MSVESSLLATPPLEAALESLLRRSSLRINVVAEPHQCGDWFLEAPQHPCGLFHLVGNGACQVEGNVFAENLHLASGDLIILPQGDAHRLRAHDTSAQASTSLICGELHFSQHTAHPLSQALPSYMVVRAAEAAGIFGKLSTMMVQVAQSGLPGRQVLLDKLADTLFTLAVCDYAQKHDARRGLFAGLTDARVGRVLRAVHDDPGHAWTMSSMASLACMSRSAFAERFTVLMGQPPMQYVTQWRVSVAEHLLRDSETSVAAIAEELGYQSEAAFRRLFKRVSGRCPGAWRSRGTSATLN